MTESAGMTETCKALSADPNKRQEIIVTRHKKDIFCMFNIATVKFLMMYMANKRAGKAKIGRNYKYLRLWGGSLADFAEVELHLAGSNDELFLAKNCDSKTDLTVLNRCGYRSTNSK